MAQVSFTTSTTKKTGTVPVKAKSTGISDDADWIQTPGHDGHFSDSLRLKLQNITLNQFNFFYALHWEYPYMLANKKYDENEGNSEAFWESIVVDYEVSGYPFECSQNRDKFSKFQSYYKLQCTVHHITSNRFHHDIKRDERSLCVLR